MTKRERILAAVARRETDRLPYTFWTHLPGIDLDPERLADATYDFFKKYDVDLIKTMDNGMYSVEDFGCEIDYSEIKAGGAARIRTTPVVSAADWARIAPVPLSAPALSRELRSLSLLLEKTKRDDVPVIFTVFSPLTTAEKLSNKQLYSHIEQGAGDSINQALDAITETTCALVRKAIELGADGVYFATQLSNYSAAGEKLYAEYGVPYDLRVLQASTGSCDTLHAHGDDILFDQLRQYPVDIFNWHVGESLPELREGAVCADKCIMGGLKRQDITACSKGAVHNQIFNCLQALGGRGHILSPGCVVRYPLDEEMLHYIRTAKDEIERRFNRV